MISARRHWINAINWVTVLPSLCLADRKHKGRCVSVQRQDRQSSALWRGLLPIPPNFVDLPISRRSDQAGSRKHSNTGSTVATSQKAFGDKGIIVSYAGSDTDVPKVNIGAGTGANVTFSITDKVLTLSVPTGKTGADVVTAWNAWKSADTNQPQGFNVSQNSDGSGAVPATNNASVELTRDTLATIRSTNTALYNQIKTLMTQQRVVLPPSAAVAGVYAAVDPRAWGVESASECWSGAL